MPLCDPGEGRAPVGGTSIAPVPPGGAPFMPASPISRAEQQGRQMGGGSGYSSAAGPGVRQAHGNSTVVSATNRPNPGGDT